MYIVWINTLNVFASLNSVRKLLSYETTAIISHALITSRIDNGNSLRIGITDILLRKCQLAQNATARVLQRRENSFTFITPILKDLHWLPIRIKFKLLIFTWKYLHGTAPLYLSHVLFPYNPVRTLRSSDKHLLVIPRTSSFLSRRTNPLELVACEYQMLFFTSVF